MAKRKGNPLKRKTGSREYRAICWVSAEGQTEKDYLQMDIFRTSDIIIRFPRNIHPGRRNPTAVLKRFHKAMRTEEFREGDEAWIIVDVDTWDKTEFSQLLDWTKEDPRHHLAISNPKFELFLIMHFERGGGCTTPQKVDAVLKRHMPRYSKRIGTSQFTLQDVKVAIRNAKIKRDCTDSLIPEPGTTDVHQLVKRLIEGM